MNQYLKNEKGFVALITLMMLSQALLLGLLSTSYALSLRNDLLLTKIYRMKATFGLDSCLAWVRGKLHEDRAYETQERPVHFSSNQCSVSIVNQSHDLGGSAENPLKKFISLSSKVRNVEVSREIFGEADADGNLTIL